MFDGMLTEGLGHTTTRKFCAPLMVLVYLGLNIYMCISVCIDIYIYVYVSFCGVFEVVVLYPCFETATVAIVVIQAASTYMAVGRRALSDRPQTRQLLLQPAHSTIRAKYFASLPDRCE